MVLPGARLDALTAADFETLAGLDTKLDLYLTD
jgi:hypothetical protein